MKLPCTGKKMWCQGPDSDNTEKIEKGNLKNDIHFQTQEETATEIQRVKVEHGWSLTFMLVGPIDSFIC